MTSTSDPLATPSPWPHRLAVLLVCATFPLIWVGGLVTTYDAGMAVPDWPSTYGYNLFLYPWQTWLSGPWDLFVEHGHRLLGSLVGLITIGLVWAVFRGDRRAWVRGLAVGALLLVIGQGLLGGARVLLDERRLAMVHGCVGPLFFAYAVVIAAVTSSYWRRGRQLRTGGESLPRVALMTNVLAVVQLLVGAQLRHVSPLDQGHVFQAALWFHLLIAALLVVHILAVGWICFRPGISGLLWRAALGLWLLVVVQVLLGGATWLMKYGWPGWFADTSISAGYTILADGFWQAMVVTAHVAVGSLILATSTLVTVRAFRLVPWTAGASTYAPTVTARTAR